MDPELQAAVAAAVREATGQPFDVRSARRVGGGSIHEAWLVAGGTGRYFVKANRGGSLEMFAAEADGLEALGRAGARVPQPVARGRSQRHAFLVLEHLELRRGDDASHARLGRMLAAVHACTGAQYGWHRDNFIGSTPQANGGCANWAEFWRERRLRPQLEAAARCGYRSLARAGERLCERIDRLLAGHEPQPSLLHGDLWGGNAGFLADGTPVMFDPAVYHGDAETDLAMTELFGGFPPAFYAAYREVRPPDAGYRLRKTLYNLYHVLNHAQLFGGGYPAQAGRMLDLLLAETG